MYPRNLEKKRGTDGLRKHGPWHYASRLGGKNGWQWKGMELTVMMAVHDSMKARLKG
jgi:hypothetical protein